MEYPGSWFTKPYRHAFFAVFVALFCLSSPLTVMYALGYRYDIQNGLLRETGAVSIDIEPKNTTAYLSDLKIKTGMPVRAKNIAPGNYRLRLDTAGYYNFEKDITVGNKQTVYIKEISLLKKNEPQLISRNLPAVLSLSPDGSRLIYAIAQKNIHKIYLRINDSGAERELPMSVASQPQIFWSADGGYFFIGTKAAPFEKITAFNVNNPEAPWEIKSSGGKIEKAVWQETVEPEIIFSTKMEIFAARPTGRKIAPVSQNKFIDWHADNGKIWTIEFIEEEQKYYLIKDALGFREKFAEINPEIYQNNKAPFKILEAKNEIVLAQNKPGQILIITRAKQTTVNAQYWRLSPHEDWWLFWTPWELTTYSAGEEPYLQIRSGEGLSDIWPLDKYNTLGLIWKTRVEALFPYYSVGHNLLDFGVEKTAVDSVNKIIYFTGKIENQTGLWKLEY